MKKSSFKNKVWLYLIIFSLVILIGILVLQILSSNVYYEFSKNQEIEDIATTVKETYTKGDYEDTLNQLSFEKDICIEISEKSDIVYFTDSVSRGCLINDSREVNDYKTNFMKSNKKSITYKFINPNFKNKTIMYGLKIDENTYAFISTSLEPIGSTANTLSKQLIIIIVIMLILAFVIAYTLSKKFSKPLEDINKKSNEIAKGNYDITFDKPSDIKEISELQTTLTDMAKELSKTEEVRRELLANVSHDLKTPLTIIKANSEMVKDITYKDKEKRNKNLDTIIEEVDRLNLLVEDILDLSKIQSNSIELDIEEINLNELINSIIKRFDILCVKNKYIIKYNGFDVNILADKKKLEQAIYNLINNALNYTGKDKTIYINLIDNKETIRVEIKDTGSGIDKKDIDLIWDKYYKVDKTYNRVTYGTGLGLSIVKNIFILHNFNYGIKTSKKGTTFYFDIEVKK